MADQPRTPDAIANACHEWIVESGAKKCTLKVESGDEALLVADRLRKLGYHAKAEESLLFNKDTNQFESVDAVDVRKKKVRRA